MASNDVDSNSTTPITKLLVANRGEIARRVMRTASAMGIRTVAVFADADTDAPFVADADEAIHLPGGTAAQTYLAIDAVLDAARRSGADAVHPGYGFLSENADFARAVIDAGLRWVGPPPEAIAAMGDKLAAKALMADAGVPVLPSVELHADTDLSVAADQVGFPALVKAAAGGGGKGMRIVHAVEDLADAVAGARREAGAAFGNDTVFLERYLTGSRHVEIQILGDTHGNVVHCFERECSIQRRHQKIIEEAPSPAVDDELRARMGAAAVTAVRAIGYENAGTVEFLLADDASFAFLEVNTRLQVEHPVTEAVTGLDLVREQLRVARGEALGYDQDELAITGHAIEARIYAEDPSIDFLPATGTITSWLVAEHPVVRVDAGVSTGSVVGIDYDPMLAKVIAHAPTRAEAAGRLALALERMEIQGIVTNRDFLVSTLRHPRFLAGDTTTDFIERADPDRVRTPGTTEVHRAAVAAALAGQERRRAAATRLRGLRSGWRNSIMPPQSTSFVHRDQPVAVTYHADRDRIFDVTVAGDAGRAVIHGFDHDRLDFALDGHRSTVSVRQDGERWYVHGPDGTVTLDELPRFPVSGAASVAGALTAPMPGKVLEVHCTAGDEVVAGTLLVVLEAMKMEHRIVAPGDGVVDEVRAEVGDQVSTGDLLVVIGGTKEAS